MGDKNSGVFSGQDSTTISSGTVSVGSIGGSGADPSRYTLTPRSAPTPVLLDPNDNDPLEPGGNTNTLSIRSAGSGWSGGDSVVAPAISVRSEVPPITRMHEPDPLRPRLLDETQLECWRRQHPPSRAQHAKCNARTPNPAALPLATRAPAVKF
ncbi:hypothetical protein FRC12_012641 [Ceratobasidium sp. 428]|nr:hypothetical protein FRC12_012641 [Ceratobasidium sp. 428]